MWDADLKDSETQKKRTGVDVESASTGIVDLIFRLPYEEAGRTLTGERRREVSKV